MPRTIATVTPDISLTTLLMLCAAAAAAGWIDAVVGGGGLLQLPALMVGLPHVPPAHVLGTNKAVAICGTAAAAVAFTRRSPLNLRMGLRIGLAALGGSLAGAFFASGINSAVLRPLIMGILLAVLVFVLLRPTFGVTKAVGAPVTRRRVLTAILVAGLGIGFYDGLIGPGTGTFLVLALAGILHMDLVTASGTSKIINVCTNIGALVTFAWQGSVLWQVAAPMALFNLAGGAVGARMALKRGSGFVRGVLVVVVVSLLGKLGYDQWIG
ncbi:TSUP family transporter [Streptomyces sp. NPDC046215]|uniref:Probable membrane transporter protein n=1 Tax=Streptomyces stramineus TaxID=173861 RepID=A0ABN0ZRP9_9ACTN